MITPQKLCLIILDGFWINNTSDEENSIVQAHSPLFEKLFSQKFTSLWASGNYVGLPEGQIWNSEVGHLTIGSGRILFQSSVKMSKLFTEKSFEKLDAFQKWVFHAQKNKSKNTWEYIKIYFPDIWQYLVIIIILVLAAIFIL